MIHNYLSNQNQRVNVNSNYISWSKIINGVPQGSVLGPLLFNIYLSEFQFTSNSEIANYADDNSTYALKQDIESVITKLEEDSQSWWAYSVMVSVALKFHNVYDYISVAPLASVRKPLATGSPKP